MNLKLEVETEQNNSAGKILAELTKVGLPQPKLPEPEPEPEPEKFVCQCGGKEVYSYFKNYHVCR
jgi:hypothetical protein